MNSDTPATPERRPACEHLAGFPHHIGDAVDIDRNKAIAELHRDVAELQRQARVRESDALSAKRRLCELEGRDLVITPALRAAITEAYAVRTAALESLRSPLPAGGEQLPPQLIFSEDAQRKSRRAELDRERVPAPLAEGPCLACGTTHEKGCRYAHCPHRKPLAEGPKCQTCDGLGAFGFGRPCPNCLGTGKPPSSAGPAPVGEAGKAEPTREPLWTNVQRDRSGAYRVQHSLHCGWLILNRSGYESTLGYLTETIAREIADKLNASVSVGLASDDQEDLERSIMRPTPSPASPAPVGELTRPADKPCPKCGKMMPFEWGDDGDSMTPPTPSAWGCECGHTERWTGPASPAPDAGCQKDYDEGWSGFRAYAADDTNKVCSDADLGREFGDKLRELSGSHVGTAALKAAYAWGWRASSTARDREMYRRYEQLRASYEQNLAACGENARTIAAKDAEIERLTKRAEGAEEREKQLFNALTKAVGERDKSYTAQAAAESARDAAVAEVGQMHERIKSLDSELATLRESVNAKYWEGVRNDNTRIRDELAKVRRKPSPAPVESADHGEREGLTDAEIEKAASRFFEDRVVGQSVTRVNVTEWLAAFAKSLRTAPATAKGGGKA